MSTSAAIRGADVVRIPPPLFFVATFGLGLLVHAVTGDRMPGRPLTAWLGIAIMIGALGFAVSAIGMFVRAGTTIIPHHQVSKLVTGGPFRVSRNPMYAALTLLCIGAAFALGTWWPLVTLVPTVAAIGVLVIGPEERYLEREFGDDYRAYCRQVRRWL